jgi:hypothetical protein
MNTFLTSISAKGLKSGDFSHALDRVNIIVGRSGKGKTARLDAIRLALAGGTILGRQPELKTRTIDIMDLARNGEIMVEALDNQGRKNQWRWTRGKNVQELCAMIPPTPAILLDPSQYFSLSDAKKIEYVFGLVQIEDQPEFTGKGVIASLRNIRLANNTAETERALSEIIELASGTNQDRTKDEPVQRWLADLIQTLKVRQSSAKAIAERMTHTVQGVTQLSADQTVVDPKQLEADIRRIESAQLILPTELTVDETALNTELESLERLISKHTSKTLPARNHVNDQEHKIKDLNAEIERFNAETRELIEAHNTAIAAENCPTCGASCDFWTGANTKENLLRAHLARMKAREQRKSELTLTLEQADETLLKIRKILAKCEAEDAEQAVRQDRANKIHALLHRVSEAKLKAQRERDDVLAAKRGALAVIQRSFTAQQVDEQRNAQALLETRKAEADLEVTKAAISRCEEIQSQMVSHAFETILKTVNDICHGIADMTTIEYRAELGMWSGASWIKHSAFSETQKGLVYTGLSLALAKDSPLKIVLLDEMGRMDIQTFCMFVVKIISLVEQGIIGQFVGCYSTTNLSFGKEIQQSVNIIEV